MPRALSPAGPALLLLLLLAGCRGQGPDIEDPAPQLGDGGGDAAEQLPAAPEQALVAAQDAEAEAEAEPQDLSAPAAVDEAVDLQAASASDASADAPPQEDLSADQPLEQEQALEPPQPPEQLLPALEPSRQSLAEAEADASDAAPEPTQDSPLPEPMMGRSVEDPGDSPSFQPALEQSSLGRSIADGLGRAMGAEVAGGGGSATRGLVKRFMQNFARNMKYAVLADSKGDMPEEERLRQMRALESHQTPEERRRLLRAIGEAPSEDGAPEADEGRRTLALAAEGGFRRRPELHRHAHSAHQRLRMLNNRGEDVDRRHLQMLNMGSQSQPGAALAATAATAADIAAEQQRGPPLLALDGGLPADKEEGRLQRWRSSFQQWYHHEVGLLERRVGRSGASSALGSPLFPAVALVLSSLLPLMLGH